MTKTKDEIMEEIKLEPRSPIQNMNVHQAFEYGVSLAVSHMYDARQREINELREQVKWWAKTWQEINKPHCEVEHDICVAMDAAAAKVMEGK